MKIVTEGERERARDVCSNLSDGVSDCVEEFSDLDETAKVYHLLTEPSCPSGWGHQQGNGICGMCTLALIETILYVHTEDGNGHFIARLSRHFLSVSEGG